MSTCERPDLVLLFYLINNLISRHLRVENFSVPKMNLLPFLIFVLVRASDIKGPFDDFPFEAKDQELCTHLWKTLPLVASKTDAAIWYGLAVSVQPPGTRAAFALKARAQNAHLNAIFPSKEPQRNSSEWPVIEPMLEWNLLYSTVTMAKCYTQGGNFEALCWHVALEDGLPRDLPRRQEFMVTLDFCRQLGNYNPLLVIFPSVDIRAVMAKLADVYGGRHAGVYIDPEMSPANFFRDLFKRPTPSALKFTQFFRFLLLVPTSEKVFSTPQLTKILTEGIDYNKSRERRHIWMAQLTHGPEWISHLLLSQVLPAKNMPFLKELVRCFQKDDVRSLPPKSIRHVITGLLAPQKDVAQEADLGIPSQSCHLILSDWGGMTVRLLWANYPFQLTFAPGKQLIISAADSAPQAQVFYGVVKKGSGQLIPNDASQLEAPGDWLIVGMHKHRVHIERALQEYSQLDQNGRLFYYRLSELCVMICAVSSPQ
jgi:hypothetical protein